MFARECIIEKCIPQLKTKKSYTRFLIILCRFELIAYDFKVIFRLKRISVSSRIMKENAWGALQRVALISHVPAVFSHSSSSTSCVSLIAGTRFSNYSLIYAFLPSSTVSRWHRAVNEKGKGQKRSEIEVPLLKHLVSRPFLARFSISQPTRELCDYVRPISVPRRNILHSTIESRRFALSAVLNDRCSDNFVIINSIGNYHDMLYASYICDECSSAQISSNEIRKSVNLN